MNLRKEQIETQYNHIIYLALREKNRTVKEQPREERSKINQPNPDDLAGQPWYEE